MAEEAAMVHTWEPDPATSFARRLGKSAKELGKSDDGDECPDIWLLDNGDVAVIGRDRTAAYRERLPGGLSVPSGSRLVVIPRSMLISAKPDIPDA